MTSLEKLAIQGIRSFSPKGGENGLIEFEKPLTIIVGHNGAGKTTILESLLFATTGEYPPGAKKGGAFVFDPTLAGIREVKASVKLMFKNKNQSTVTVVRLLQATVAKSKISQKFLDAAITIQRKDGSKQTTNAKCAEVDTQVPLLFGASKAVLANVIFCHQEESNWPLVGTDADLKKRFDSIFATESYDKALKELKNLHKDVSANIRVLKPELKLCQEKRSHAVKANQEVHHLSESIEKVAQKIQSMSEQRNVQQARIDELAGKEDQLVEMVTEISRQEAVLQEATKTLVSDKQAMTSEYKESDAELQRKMDSFQEAMAEAQSVADAQEDKVKDASASLSALEDKLQQVRSEKARMEARMESHAKAVEERDAKFLDMQVEDLEGAREALRVLQQTLSTVQKKRAAERSELALQATAAKESATTHRVELTSCERQIAGAKAQRDKMQGDLRDKAGLGNTLPQLEEEAAAAQQTLEKLKRGALEELHAQRDSLRADKTLLEERLARLGKALAALNKGASARGALEAAQRRAEALREQLEGAEEMPADEEAARQLDEAQSALRVAQGAVRQADAGHAEAKGRESSLAQEQKRREARIGVLVEKRDELMPAELNLTVAEMLQQLEEQLLALQTTRAESTATQTLYTKFVEHAKSEGSCGVCLRAFDKKADTKSHISHLQGELKKARADSRAEEQEVQGMVKQLRDLQPEMDELMRLQKQLKAAKKAQRELTSELQSLASVQSVAADDLKAAEAHLDKTRKLASDAAQANRVKQELAEVEAQVAAQQELLGDTGGEQHGSSSDVSRDYEAAQGKLKELSGTIANVEARLAKHSDAVAAQEDKVRHLKDAILAAHNSEQSVAGLQEGIARLEANLAELESRRVKLGKLLAKSSAEQEKAEKLLRAATAKYDKKVQKAGDAAQAMRRKVDLAEDLCSKIDEKEGAAATKTLQAHNKKLKATEKKIASARETRDELQEELQNMKSRVGSSQERGNIQANLRWRAQKKKVANLRELLREAQEELKELQGGAHGAEELREARQQVDKLTQNVNRLEGKASTERDQLAAKQKELKRMKPDRIRKEYNEKLVELRLAESQAKDLDQYHKAVDKALMKYHSDTMKTINRILKELWQVTYRGSDIDTIEINADTTKTARGTNKYRVTMIKGDTELDMRGRCSAGQKVLASICIRLALAECFGFDCGILALDEPTTNLDRINIESLANALVTILATRPNFQLLVVTHDEEFVQMLGRSEHCDNYWYVSKDAHGYSTVAKKNIIELE